MIGPMKDRIMPRFVVFAILLAGLALVASCALQVDRMLAPAQGEQYARIIMQGMQQAAARSGDHQDPARP